LFAGATMLALASSCRRIVCLSTRTITGKPCKPRVPPGRMRTRFSQPRHGRVQLRVLKGCDLWLLGSASRRVRRGPCRWRIRGAGAGRAGHLPGLIGSPSSARSNSRAVGLRLPAPHVAVCQPGE